MIISDLSFLDATSNADNVSGGDDIQINVALVGQDTTSVVRNRRGGVGSVRTTAIANVFQSNSKRTTIID